MPARSQRRRGVASGGALVRPLVAERPGEGLGGTLMPWPERRRMLAGIHFRSEVHMHSQATPRRRLPLAAILVVPLVVALLMTLFAWPSEERQDRKSTRLNSSHE